MPSPASELVRFLGAVEKKRTELRCSNSSAWFRRVKCHTHTLVPPLFREQKKSGYTPATDPAQVSLTQTAELEWVNHDNRAEISRLITDIRDRENSVKSLKKRKKKIQEMIRKYDERMFGRVGSKNLDIDKMHLMDRLSYIDKRVADHNESIRAAITSINTIASIFRGEYDAFIDFIFRSGNQDSSSWVTLARMQHHRIPTRMIDWTESFLVAAYFAVEDFIDILIDKRSFNFWEIKHEWFNSLPDPKIFVLNPFSLARVSIGENSLISPATNNW